MAVPSGWRDTAKCSQMLSIGLKTAEERELIRLEQKADADSFELIGRNGNTLKSFTHVKKLKASSS